MAIYSTVRAAVTRSAPPKPPSDESFSEMGFVRKGMVDWLAPRQLVRTGVKAVLSALFEAYADRREMQSALAPPRIPSADYSAGGELWFDYVADLGDGFNPTYAIARLLAAQALDLPAAGSLPRGRLLVMGGDQVYPAPSPEEYRDRLEGPYRAALPWVSNNPPHLFAIPGNHDWYDGLTSFLRLFCQSPRERWIGGWLPRQERSYFALKLPGGWWLWGADMQLEANLDKPQLDYFQDVAARMKFDAGEQGGYEPKVILVTAQPSWVHCAAGDPDPACDGTDSERFEGLAYFEERVIRAANLRLAAVVSGDLHHYCRYEAGSGTQRITCGGGGAYLYPTHQMPSRLSVPEGNGAVIKRVEYARQCTFPSDGESKRLTFGCLRIPWRNWRFSALLGALYLLLAWIVQSASLANNRLEAPAAEVAAGNWPESAVIAAYFSRVFIHSPASVVFALLVVLGFFVFAWREGRKFRPWLPVLGAAHGMAHVALALALFAGFSSLNIARLALPVGSAGQILLLSAQMLAAGALFGGFLYAVYLLLCAWTMRAHLNEVFSAQAIENYKSFLRFHVARDGLLTVYPIGLKNVPEWKLRKSQQPEEPWFEPDGRAELAPELIEPPLRIR